MTAALRFPMTEDEETAIGDVIDALNVPDDRWLVEFDELAKLMGFSANGPCECVHEASYGHDPRCGYYREITVEGGSP